jgi:hypothetical protein
MRFKLILLFLSLIYYSAAQNRKSENFIIVTLDGFRWQELFEGADSVLLHNKKYTIYPNSISSYWKSDILQRREILLPFLWNVIGKQGQLYGNRNYGNLVNCANPYWFSYPGYSEMLTGRVDRKMSTNRKVENPNANVLEFIHQQSEYKNNVAVFSTWDVIPYVIRASSNGIYTNKAQDTQGKRCDESTFQLAFDYLEKNRPKVMFLSLDGTDAKAHAGKYGEYLHYAHLADSMISVIWQWVQSQENYKDKTTLLITTDHGRGRGHSWKTHGRWALGSNQMWFAVIGPDTPPLGEMKTSSRYFQKQIAKTTASFLGLDYELKDPVGNIVEQMFFQPHSIVVAHE